MSVISQINVPSIQWYKTSRKSLEYVLKKCAVQFKDYKLVYSPTDLSSIVTKAVLLNFPYPVQAGIDELMDRNWRTNIFSNLSDVVVFSDVLPYELSMRFETINNLFQVIELHPCTDEINLRGAIISPDLFDWYFGKSSESDIYEVLDFFFKNDNLQEVLKDVSEDELATLCEEIGRTAPIHPAQKNPSG